MQYDEKKKFKEISRDLCNGHRSDLLSFFLFFHVLNYLCFPSIHVLLNIFYKSRFYQILSLTDVQSVTLEVFPEFLLCICMCVFIFLISVPQCQTLQIFSSNKKYYTEYSHSQILSLMLAHLLEKKANIYVSQQGFTESLLAIHLHSSYSFALFFLRTLMISFILPTSYN